MDNGVTLKQIFDQYVEESITDEQIRRILAPVLAMIRAGVFDRPRLRLLERE